MRYSPSKPGWYPEHTDYPNVTDLIEIDDALYLSLRGKQIETGPDGLPREYLPPPRGVVVPAQVTMRQARLALLAAGKLALVDAAIASLSSPEREMAQIEWEYGAFVERASPIVTLLTSALGMDEAGMDALFIDAGEK